MSFVISSVLPFPPLSWWAYTAIAHRVFWDKEEPFRKMTYRNRYYISGGNGVILLSIPLNGGGRHQRTPMKLLVADPQDDWRTRHFRTLVSAYARSPYFEYYEPELKALFETPFESLVDFSMAALKWVKQHLGLHFEESLLDQNEEAQAYSIDLRRIMPASNRDIPGFPQYHQVFQDKLGFLADLSVLDLLFAEGPLAGKWLIDNSEMILTRPIH